MRRPRVHMHLDRSTGAVPNQDGASHYYRELAALLPRFLLDEVEFHDVASVQTLDRILDDDIVLCAVGPYAYLYAWHRHRNGAKYAIVRDVHTAFWEGYVLQERACLRLRQPHDRVLFPSVYAKQVYERFFPGAYADGLAAIWYPFLESLPPCGARHRGTLGMRLGYLGSLGEDKNLPDLVGALIEVKGCRPDTTFYFCGVPFSESCRPDAIVRRLVNSGFTTNDVTYGGVLGRESIAEFYNSIDLLLFPSTSSIETLGRVVLEALHFGVPVIAADHGAMRELLPCSRRIGVEYLAGADIPLTQAVPLGRVDPSRLAAAILDETLREPLSIPDVDRYRYSTFAKWLSSPHDVASTCEAPAALGFDFNHRAFESFPLETTGNLYDLFYDIYGGDPARRSDALRRLAHQAPESEHRRFAEQLASGGDWMDLGSFPRLAWHVAGTSNATVRLRKSRQPDANWVAFFAFNGMGLGHVRRLSRLCRRMLDIDESGTIRPLFLTNSVHHEWLRAEGWPYYYLPSEFEDSFTFAASERDFDIAALRKFPPRGLGAKVIERIVEYVHPRAVIADTYFFEGLPDFCQAAGIPFLAVFDSDWCEELHAESVREVLNHGGGVIVANEPDRRGRLSENFYYAGPFVVQRDAAAECKLAGRYWRKKGAFRILCVQGGGGFTPANSAFEARQPGSFVSAIDSLVGSLLEQAEVEALFFAGPYHDLGANGARPRHLVVQRFEPDLAWLFASADLALMRSGYGQVTEAFSMSCPAVTYPRLEASDDQRQNLAAWRGHEGLICWNDGIAESLPVVRELLHRERLACLRSSLESVPKPDGLQTAATIVLREVHNGGRAAAC